jgi:hypothetical protein
MWWFLRRAVVVLLVVTIVAVALHGPLYRMVVNYQIIGERGGAEPTVSRSSTSRTAEFDMDELIDAALDSVAERLHFSTGKVSSDPDRLMNGGPANCIGYAALFKTILQKELSSTGHADAFAVEQVIGELHIGDWNMHSAFRSPFWKDHDIVRITDRSTGTRIYVDPTLFDVIGIERVSGP